MTLVTDAGLASLVKLHPKLRRLNLGEARHITDKGFASLARLTQLEDLTVRHARITDQGIAHLSRLRLSKLTLRFSGVTDAAMPVLAKMSTLEHLDLFGARKVTDTGVTQLAALRNLKTLNVGLTQGVTDRTMTELAKLPLMSLDLSSHGCIKSPHSMKVTDEGLQTLASMPTLRRIVLNGCPAVTREGVRALRAAAPQRKVLYRRRGD